MKGKLINYEGYNYTKNGVHKQGRTITVESLETRSKDDDNGNFVYGIAVQSINLRDVNIPSDFFVENLGQIVELKFEKGVGERFETLVGIELVE